MLHHHLPAILRLIAVAVFMTAPGWWSGPDARGAESGDNALHEHVTAELATLYDDATDKASIDRISTRIDELSREVVAYGVLPRDLDLFREIAMTSILHGWMNDLQPAEVRDWAAFFDDHKELRSAFVRVGYERNARPREALALLRRFRNSPYAERLNDYVELVAAVCHVHAQPLVRRINENKTEAPDPIELFAYFASNEHAMQFGVRDMPGELLTYVVDATVSIPELQWALAQYSRDRNVGRRFFEIDYDREHALNGAPKKCTQAGYGLLNIRKYGGVCADQAFYAVSVGKALGIPTAYTHGRDAEVSHAWVGYLEGRGRGSKWNDEAGRYESYQNVRGTLFDPVSRDWIPDSYVAILADALKTSAEDRASAIALKEAAEVLHKIASAPGRAPEYPPNVDSWGDADLMKSARAANIADVEDLVEESLRRYPGFAPSWKLIGAMAQRDELDYDSLKRWSDIVLKMCGSDYPDFAVDVVVPMIESVDDPQKQNDLWNRAFSKFSRRIDLGAEIRFHQGEMWENHDNMKMAAKCYEDVITRYMKSGAFVLNALARFESLLRDSGKARAVPDVYGQVWKRLEVPQSYAPGFFQQSNWYRIGFMYAVRLREAGRTSEAAAVESRLKGASGG